METDFLCGFLSSVCSFILKYHLLILLKRQLCASHVFSLCVFHDWILLGTFTQHKDSPCVILLLVGLLALNIKSRQFLLRIYHVRKKILCLHFSYLMYGNHDIWTQFKSTGKEKTSADHKTPKQHIGFDHLWTWGTVCVQQKMKMFVRSETLICSKCSLNEWISIIGWIPPQCFVTLWSSKLIIWLTNVKALSYSRKQKTQFSLFHYPSWRKGSMRE